MCGIIGYVGPRDAAPILLGGLRRLEYRGYDSAGIAMLVGGQRLEIRRAVGKLDNLRKLLDHAPLSGQIGMGHTRWATHGRPSETNAHPHQAGPVAVIHNGIIENYVELRESLLQRGHRLKSETDTELISHLIEERLRDKLPLADAVRAVIRELRGSFSIVVLAESEPGKLVAAKTATPLVLGVGDGENFVASDIPAILEHTRRAIVLEDGEMAELSAEQIRLTSFAGAPIVREPRMIEWDAVAATKGGYQHYLRKEIAEQPQAWIDTLSGRASAGSAEVRFESELLPPAGAEAIRRIVMVSAGASWISSQIGKFMLEELCGIPAEVDYSAEFRYRSPAVDDHTLIIAVSQSGETADTLAAMEEAKRRGSYLLALTNTLDSSIARKANAQLYTRCGPEISVTTTKCFLTQIEAFYLLSIHLAARLGRLTPHAAEELLRPVFAIPHQIEAILKQERLIEKIARKYGKARDFLYLGRGINYPVALEGALKLKEISYIHAEGYAAGELKHGPIALIDDTMPVIVIAPFDRVFEKTVSNMQEVAARGGRIILVTDPKGAKEATIESAVTLSLPDMASTVTPLVYA
ncbi:MAG: glutamine--fructose-6-phosphate transaminase (isomerizing), partial [Candidatus Binataceae bacterium]